MDERILLASSRCKAAGRASVEVSSPPDGLENNIAFRPVERRPLASCRLLGGFEPALAKFLLNFDPSGAIPMQHEGIEIHFDDKHGLLELACEPDAFASFRELSRTMLVDFAEIQFDKVVEITIIDSHTAIAKRNQPGRRFRDWTIVGIVTSVFAGLFFFAAIGFVVALKWFAAKFIG